MTRPHPPTPPPARGRLDTAGSYAAGLVALATSLLLYAHSRLPHGLALLAGSALLYAVLTREGWRGKSSVRIAGLLMLAIGLLLRQHLWDALVWSEGLTRYRSVIALLFGIALLQRSFKALEAGEVLRAALKQTDVRWLGPLLITLASVLALPLSLATVPIMTTLLVGVVTPARDTARISMRMVGLTMYILPTTVASVAVSSSILHLHATDILILGMPLFLIGALLNFRVRPQWVRRTATAPPDLRPVKIFALAFITLFSLSLAIGLGAPEAVAMAGLGLFFLDMRRRGASVRGGLRESSRAAKSCSAEVILMLACGLLAYTLGQVATGPSVVVEFMRTLWAFPGAAQGIVLFLLPLISLAGIHPLILFNVIFPLVDQSMLGAPAAQYIAWVSMFMLAQLISPVSISAILAAGALKVSPADTSYKLHYKFAAALSVIVFAYLLISERGLRAFAAPLSS